MKIIKSILSTAAFMFIAIALNAQAVKTGINIGDKFTDLKFNDPNGKEIALSSIKGKIILLDFWASWCRPCRGENPNVVAAYNKYKDTKFNSKAKGFTVYSVSLDQDKTQWTNAIKQDGLVWPYHVCDFGMWSSKAAAIYQINSIPQSLLIDENGIIIGRNLRGELLQQKLESLIKKKK